ncbi:MAG: hypothetical protein FWC92_08885 [Defluviitaleaceae bacterium]|nr:hypothetical protein [Defluviitaleaceae bacterium]
MKKSIIILCLLLICMLLLTGCVPGGGANTYDDPAGLFWGIWHGWIAPISLILSFLNDHHSIYEVYNTGFGYNFGFYVAIISGFGGISIIRKGRK